MEEGKSNNDASKNKSSCRSGNSPKLHSLEEGFLKALESPSFLHSINGKWNHSHPGFKMLLSYFAPGPKICQGPAGHVQSGDDRQQEVEERRAGWNPSQMEHKKQCLKFYFRTGTGNGMETLNGYRAECCFIFDNSCQVRNSLLQISWFGIHSKASTNDLIIIRH